MLFLVALAMAIADRKRVAITFGTRETKMPAIKKHRCLRFASDQVVGYVEKVTRTEMKVLASIPTAKVRVLGAQVTNVESPKSYMTKVNKGENIVAVMRRLEGNVEQLTHNSKGQKKEIAQSNKKLSGLEVLFGDEGYLAMQCVREVLVIMLSTNFMMPRGRLQMTYLSK